MTTIETYKKPIETASAQLDVPVLVLPETSENGSASEPVVVPPVGTRNYGASPKSFTEADTLAQEKMGAPPARSNEWRNDFWRGFEIAARKGVFVEACKTYETCVNTVRAYFAAVLEDSNRKGKDTWTGIGTLADRMGCHKRTVQRARAVARVCGFEVFRFRRWINTKINAWVGASSRIRLILPESLLNPIAAQRAASALEAKLKKPPVVYSNDSGKSAGEVSKAPKPAEFEPYEYADASEKTSNAGSKIKDRFGLPPSKKVWPGTVKKPPD